jgi:predicted AlkP superfamily pyrophosphatase or phosphodiesterase
MKDSEICPFQTSASLWVSVRKLLEDSPAEKKFIWVYWGQLDGISHHYGPDDERAEAEFLHFSNAYEQFFLDPLSAKDQLNTLVILTADHGQTYTPLDPNNNLKHHPKLNQYLRLKPTCENRFASLYLQPGTEDAIREYFIQEFPERFSLISQKEALQASLFGPGLHHPKLNHRLGDIFAIAQDNAYLWWSDKKDFLLGRHGSMHPDDMLVPFLAGKLS